MQVIPDRRAILFFLVLPVLAVISGCNEPTMERMPRPGELILTVGGNKIICEVAENDRKRQLGLMHRTELAQKRGMLFVWPTAIRQSFWMKNTSIPLSIAFINFEGEILQIEDLRPHDETSIRSKDEVRYALEMNRGWFDNNGLKAGATFDDFQKEVGGINAR